MRAAPAFAGLGNHRIDIHEMPQPAGLPVRDGGADHARVGMDGQHDLIHLFGRDGVGHIRDMGFERDRR
jgi:hypothetical protein